MSAYLISVIVTTYDRPDALDAALAALAGQTDRNFEIVVADDGSGPETARLIEGWGSRLPVALQHVWQENKGFRGAEIRNRGIRASRGHYCIFVDGDCLARPDFVAAHRRLAERRWFVAGNRILLSPTLTELVLAGKVAAQTWDFPELVRARLHGRINRLLPAMPLPLGPMRKRRHGDWQGAKTCNLAVARDDLERIDGFDASYTGWGLEDSDLVVRLLRARVRRKDGRFATGVFHLWHTPADRSGLPSNQRRLEEVLAGDRIRAKCGLSMLFGPAKTALEAS